MDFDIRVWADLSKADRDRILRRSETVIDQVLGATEEIVTRVRDGGDGALRELTKRFDGVDVDTFRVSDDEFRAAEKLLDEDVLEAVALAVSNVMEFHKIQRPNGLTMVETMPGLYAGERAGPIPSVCLYVPRGKGSFPSMLYMLAVPARLAGVKRICVTTPPNSDGSVDPACLYAAKLCGVHEVYRLGGAQAVAAFAFGTESILAVDKIVGPGSPFVAAAKRIVNGVIDTGLPAGPSESIVLADDCADPWKVALDLAIEAEHGDDSSALLVTDSPRLAKAVADNLERIVEDLPEPRRGYVETVLSGFGGIILTADRCEAAEVVNMYAPEHLQIQTADPWDTLELIENAGEILLGDNVPFSVANYAAGPNAVLPTGGNARTWSPVSVRDFMKYSSVIYATGRALEAISPAVTTLADYEGFPSHSRALTRRKGE